MKLELPPEQQDFSPSKGIVALIILTGLILGVAMVMSSCVTSETTITAPDGTVTRNVTRATDTEALTAGGSAAANAALLFSQLRGGK